MVFATAGSNATLLPDGDVLVTGGKPTFAELYHPATGTWSDASAGLPTCLSHHGVPDRQHHHAARHRQRPARRRGGRVDLEPANHTP